LVVELLREEKEASEEVIVVDVLVVVKCSL